MSKISEMAAAAFLQGRNWSRDNTEVVLVKTGRLTDVTTVRLYLHSSCIAERIPNLGVWITTAGYDTVTTRSRLNALPGVELRVRKGQLYLNGELWDGKPVRVTH